jgi:DNA-binding MarR family transcriptional regulator
MDNNDFLKELGYLGFTVRLKRLSDAMMHDGRRMYRELDVDIEPNWFVIFKLLNSRGQMTVMEISESIMMAHPSVIAITNKMIDKGYLISEKDKTDSRKRVLELSDRAIKMLPEYEKIWKAGENGIEKALFGLDALDLIATLEKKYFNKGFAERTIKQLKQKNHERNGGN